MGPGTGLGQANLYWSQNLDGYRVWPSEGSHSSFAPRGWKQRALQTFVERQLGYCEVEHVSLRCSGCKAISWGSAGLSSHHWGHLHYVSPDMWPLSFPGEGCELQASPFSLQAFAQKRMMCLLSMQPPALVQLD